MKFQKQADKLYEKLETEEVNGELIYYKKRRVYPVINRDGSLNLFNLLTGGTWLKLLGTLILIAIILGFIFEYHQNLQTCADVISELNLQANLAKNLSLNIPNITFLP